MRHAIRGLLAFCVLVYSTEGLKAGCINGGCFYPTATYHTPYVAPTVVNNIYNKYLVFDFTPPLAVGYALPYAALPATTAPAAVAPQLPPPAAPAPIHGPSPCEARLEALTARFALLEARLNGGGNPAPIPQNAPQPPNRPTPVPPVPEQQPQVPPMDPVNGPPNPERPNVPKQNKLPGQAIIQHCASCHDSSVADSKGKGVKLTRGVVFSGGEIRGGEAFKLDDALYGACFREIVSRHMPLKKTLDQAQMNALFTDLLDLGASK